MEMKKQIVYIDLDNTLVNFKSGIAKCSPEELAPYEHDEKGKPHYDDVPYIFSKMEPIEGAVEAFQFLARNFDVYILSTAPWENPTAWSDKLEWVKKYLGDAAYKRLILTHHKELNLGDFLIDDRTNNGAADFQGIHIQFGQGEFKDWQSVVNYFKATPTTVTG